MCNKVNCEQPTTRKILFQECKNIYAKNMSPGVNDGSRSTGTLPKSNRRNDRNRERSAANQFAIRSAYHGYAQHSNNLVN